MPSSPIAHPSDGRLLETLDRDAAVPVEDDNEPYGLDWPGKKAARRQAASAPKGTLRTAPGEGAFETTTRNLLIIGDNLEALRLMQKSYAGRIKLIYIDPPYNTGRGKMYKDSFSGAAAPGAKAASRANGAGPSGERAHCHWLNMMLPRLMLARALLREDGLIAVSIDDREVHRLRLLLDEVLGEENFIAQIVWNTDGHTDNQYDIKVTHEYILLYARDAERVELGYVVDPGTRAESNVWKGFAENSITKNGPANPASEICLPAGFPSAVDELALPPSNAPEAFFVAVQRSGRIITREITRRFRIRYPLRLDPMTVKGGALIAPCRVFSGWANRNKLIEFIHGGCAPLSDASGTTMTFHLSRHGVIYYRRDRPASRNIVSVWRNMGTTEKMRAKLERAGIHFPYPKPVELVRYLLRVAGTGDRDIVLDFFAGSGTTGEAVLDANREDGLDRRFILVQLPERAGSKGQGTIADITKARLHLSVKSANEGPPSEGRRATDIGFRVLYETESHLPAWLPREGDRPAPGWTAEDLLVEIMLIEGYPLDAIHTKSAHFIENIVYVVEHADIPARLFVCLDSEIAERTLHELARFDKDTFVCFDAALTGAQKAQVASSVCRVRTL